MVQLADIYMFIVSHLYTKSRQGWAADKLRDGLKDRLKPVMHKYKEWPSRAVTF